MGIAAVKPHTKSEEQAGAEEAEYALGPGSISWKVMADPSVFIIGLLRQALLLTLHPPFAAAAVDHDSFGDDPVGRFQHVAWYAYAATYGSPKEAEYVSDIVRRRHKTIVGVEPMTELPYRADAAYELAITQAMLSFSFLEAYEALNGELTSAQRDQFCMEQKVPAALLGTHPEHLPSTYGEMLDFMAHARNKFSCGLQGREILSPFANGTYPRGTAIGDLHPVLQTPAMWVLRAFADMAMLLMSWEDLELISINRKPKLGSKIATRAAYKALSKFLRGEKGQAVFAKFLGERIAPIYLKGLAADAAPGGRTRAAEFKVPDAAACLVHEDYFVNNWPGSLTSYILGGERGKSLEAEAPALPAPAPVLHNTAVSS